MSASTAAVPADAPTGDELPADEPVEPELPAEEALTQQDTAGCVSVEQSVMLELLHRVNSGAWIVIVGSEEALKNY